MMMSDGIDAEQFIEQHIARLRRSVADLTTGGRAEYVVCDDDGEALAEGKDYAAISAIIEVCNSLGCLAIDLHGQCTPLVSRDPS